MSTSRNALPVRRSAQESGHHQPGRLPALALGALLTASGLTHFAMPRFYDAIVPTLLPGSPRAWTLVSGVVEFACAAALFVPRTRRIGATAGAILFVAVFPANLQMAYDWRHRSSAEQLVAYGRLPLQIPLVLWAWAVRRRVPGRPDRPAESA